MSDPKTDAYLSDWQRRHQHAEDLVPIVGRLYRERGVILTIFGHSLVNKSPLEIVETHRVARALIGMPLTLDQTHPIVCAIADLNLAPARIDVGNLYTHFAAR